MKKLMFAAAAVISAMVGYSDVTSQNCVGYLNNGVTNGNQGVGITFYTLGKDSTMRDLTVSGYSGEYSKAGINVCTLDTFGVNTTRMYWFDTEEYVDKKGNVYPACYGWYDTKSEVSYNDVLLPQGVGLWFHAPADYTITSAGGVLNEALPVVITNGNQYCANPMPCDLTAGKVHITGYSGEYSKAGINICFLDTFGVNSTRMYWFDTEEYVDKKGNVYPACYGWYDTKSEVSYNDVVIPAGAAIWVHADKTYTMIWPSPLEKEPAAE